MRPTSATRTVDRLISIVSSGLKSFLKPQKYLLWIRSMFICHILALGHVGVIGANCKIKTYEIVFPQWNGQPLKSFGGKNGVKFLELSSKITLSDCVQLRAYSAMLTHHGCWVTRYIECAMLMLLLQENISKQNLCQSIKPLFGYRRNHKASKKFCK